MSNVTSFLESIQRETYPEPPTQIHSDLTPMAMEWVLPHVTGKQVLDVGCGQGVALREFEGRGYNAIGTGVNDEDLERCRDNGHAVIKADMHQNGIKTTFDLIWARHVLEHSPIPLYVLRLLRERLNPNGVLYVEVPMPDTDAHHEQNANHYTVLTANGWAWLLIKAGYKIIDARSLSLTLAAGGKDEYQCFICQQRHKPKETHSQANS